MKAQMRFQKIICLVMLILGAVALVYACAYLTGSVEQLFYALDNSGGTSYSDAYNIGADLYLDIQSFNDMLLWFSIIMILAAVFLFITSTNKRRKYYVTNYVATGVCAGLDIILSVVSMILNGIWKSKFLNDVDFDKWLSLSERYESITYSESTVMFDIGFVLFAIIIIASLALIFNLFWKIQNEKNEQQLLGGVALENNAEVTAV